MRFSGRVSLVRKGPRHQVAERRVRTSGALAKPGVPCSWKMAHFPTITTTAIILLLPHSQAGPKLGGRSQGEKDIEKSSRENIFTGYISFLDFFLYR